MKAPATYGLTHIAIAVNDLERTKKFYCNVFDMEVMYHEDDFIQLTTPGSHDILVFEKKETATSQTGGILHFGFRLKSPGDITEMALRVETYGGKITGRGEFVPGSPYVFFKDPDGYEVEIWYELLPV
ncbi:MAG: VOC family protein [Chitinophagaceae bacterium]|nr:VOC family protein [Chitinophagaceae bacterium]